MTEWEGNDDDFAPVFVDTVTSEVEAPHRSTGLIVFAVIVTTSLVALLVAALGSSDAPTPLADEAPTPVAETTPAPVRDDQVVVLDVGVIGASGRVRHEVTTDGDDFCIVGSGVEGERICSPMSTSPFDRGLLIAPATVGGLWCAATAVSPRVDGIIAEFTDGTSGSLVLSSAAAGDGRFAAVCRADGAGLVRLVLLRDGVVVAGSGGPDDNLVEATADPAPPTTRATVPAGWHRAQTGRFSFVASAPLLVEADPERGPSLCGATQFAVLSALADDAVLVAVTELEGAIDLPERAPLAEVAPSIPPSFRGCRADPTRLVVRSLQFTEAGRDVEVAVVHGPAASPGDIRTALEVADSLEVVPDAADAVDDALRPSSVGALGAAGVWTGREVLVWGGEQPMLTSIFDPRLTGAVSTDAAPELYSIRQSSSGARLDPETGTWTPIAPAPADVVGGRYGSVWADGELLLWATQFGDGRGLAYRPADDTWRSLAAPIVGGEGSLFAPVLLWTGDEALAFGQVFGPFTARGEVLAAAYSPVTDEWSPISYPSDTPPAPVIGGVWTGTEAVLFVGAGRGMALDPQTRAWRVFDGPVDESGVAVEPQRIVWDGDRLRVLSLDASSREGVAVLYSAAPPFGRWNAEQFPPSTVSRVDTVVAVDGGVVAIGPAVDSTTNAPRPPVGWYRRSLDGETTPVPVPTDWSRCDATTVALPDEVVFWGGTTCESTAFGVADATISRIDLPGS